MRIIIALLFQDGGLQGPGGGRGGGQLQLPQLQHDAAIGEGRRLPRSLVQG